MKASILHPDCQNLVIKDENRFFSLLEEYGFTPEEFGKNTIIIRSHPSWVPEERAEDINNMFADPEIKAIIAVISFFSKKVEITT